MTNPVVVAAEPALVAALQAIKAFITNVGTDPTKFPLTVPGAFTVLLGTLQLQIPTVAAAEVVALQSAINAKVDSAIASLQAQVAAPVAPAA